MKSDTEILLADSHEIGRAACKQLVGDKSDISIVAEVTTCEDLYSKYNLLKPDVVILEILFSNSSSLDVAKRILSRDPAARLLAWTHCGNETYFRRAIDIGILGYITKSAPMSELLEGIYHVAKGEVFVGRQMMSNVIHVGSSSESKLIGKLSNREFDVFKYMAEGSNVDAVANKLNLSPKTVRHHYANIKRKLQVENLAQLTRFAIRSEIISP